MTLEFPDGTAEPEDASPLEAIKRELLEETGYTSCRWLELGHLSPNPATHNNPVYSYLAAEVEPTSQPKVDEIEQVEASLMPLDQVIELATRGGIVQAMHMSALFGALVHLGRVH